MKISAQLALWTSGVFALVCLYIAWDGFSSLDTLTDAQTLSDARGFAWFWLFLAAIAVASGAASWWIIRTGGDDGSQ